MICKNCGKELPDNAVFCGGCGEMVSLQVDVPAVADNSKATTAKKKTEKTINPTEYLVGKQKYLLKYSGKNTKILTFISWGFALLFVGLTVLSYFLTINKPIDKVSGVEFVLEFDEVKTEYNYIMTDFIDSRNDFNFYKDAFNNYEQDPVKDVVNAMDKVIDNPSLNNIKDFTETFDNPAFEGKIQATAGTTGDKNTMISYEWTKDKVAIYGPVISVVQIVILCLMILCSALVLISSALRLNGLSIVSLFFAAIYSLLFTSLLFAAVICLSALVSATLIIITNIKYRSYKKTFYIPKNSKKVS